MLKLEKFAAAKGFTVEQLAAFGVRQGERCVEIPYYDKDGAERPRVRLRTALAANGGSFWSEGDAELVPYGLEQTIKEFVFVVEGESDTWALRTSELPAIGIPGASNTKCLRAEHVGPAEKVYVVQEPGEAGARFPHGVATALYDGGFRGSVFAITMEPHKDPHAALVANRDAFRAVMRAAVKAAKPIPRPVPVTVTSTSNVPVLSFEELAQRSSERVNWTVEGLLRKSGILLLASRPKVGKSELGRNLAKSVATGSPFLGRKVESGTVLWIGLEEPQEHLYERLGAMGMQGLDAIGYVVERPQGDESAWLRAIVEQHRPDLVIIDTIGRFSEIENINDYSQVKRATQPMIDLRTQFGTTFVLLHHNGKNDETLGSTMWEGAVDTIMSMTRSPEGTRYVSTKQRSGIAMPQTVVSYVYESGEMMAGEPARIVDDAIAKERILAFLADGKLASRQDLAQMCGRGSVIGRAAVDALVSAGIVLAKGAGTRGDPRLYALAESRVSGRDSSPGFFVEKKGCLYGEDTEDTDLIFDDVSDPSTEESPNKVRPLPKKVEDSEETEETDAVRGSIPEPIEIGPRDANGRARVAM